MAKNKNYLIGRAEVLASLTPAPKMKFDRTPLYSISESKARLEPQLKNVCDELSKMPSELCPNDLSVTRMTLHPSFIAKGHFPKKFLRQMGVQSIGSTSSNVKPDRWTRVGEPEKSPSTSLYLSGKRQDILEFSQKLSQYNDESPAAEDLEKIWSIEVIDAESKIKKGLPQSVQGYFEVGLQLLPGHHSSTIKKEFVKLANKYEYECRVDLGFDVSNLWFLPIIGKESHLKELAKFSFVRVVRPVPAMRSFRPIVRANSLGSGVNLPKEPPYAADVKVAILDGGLPKLSAVQPWVQNYRLSNEEAADLDGGPDHGLGVTSAFLFGPLDPEDTVPRPFSYVDHHRVLDADIHGDDPLELYKTLGHIEEILLSHQYEFINLSLGPDLPIDDDEIHPWTSLLDTYLADGRTFLTIAAGNNGDNDSTLGLDRIQVPSDCVNAISVGAASTQCPSWQKTIYSAIGPGRAPGRVKPDLVAFGGSPKEYFHVVSSDIPPRAVPQCGTSFSAPYLLRKAVGVRALMGHEISPLAIKALLINNANSNGYVQEHVGWGKVPKSIETLIESPDGEAKIIYQGELSPGKYLKVPVPIPDTGVDGKVTISATCCYSTPVDPQDTSMYTRAGVEISWSVNGKNEQFFKQKKIASEAELRADAAKWESVLHAEKTKIGSKMGEPTFEIHYMAREGGAPVSSSRAETIKYAFVVTLKAPKHKSIFNDILDTYADILTEIEPRITTDVTVEV
ncbi:MULTISPECIES: S8 family peptidase [Vibrio]|uniref:S8 family peptidase n=1 Tax=Vibrio TaxID=662 RepID=UPI00041C8C8D|nr:MULTISPECIES: S8 family peptidase [Vibrio]EJG0765564.1 S8 family peptidase [Vibrio parahaemolyticus O5:K30]ALM65546.1 Subtilisin-like serine protease [Vibrio parahaemolyticus]EGQ8510891.1 S8 family serine peptidase [Vibrio parahaemolyticus]EGQ9054563.1 peptidase S8 and S53, subtilisin, kexin, sedolisin [Vibrio parahaemolyticus]EHK6024986.1 S8 family peptidase [Vibrio parahaemolyticus]